MKKYSISDLQEIIPNSSVIGYANSIFFSNAKAIKDADEESIVWINSSKEDRHMLLHETRAKVIICDTSLEVDINVYPNKVFVVVDNPKLAFLRIIKSFFVSNYKYGVHPTAVIHSEAIISKNCYIGPNTYVGKSTIDENTIIDANCTIYDNVVIGKNVKVNANTAIGSEGFGYSRNEIGEFEHFPHIGGVLIEDNVDIGSNTSIDRGSLGNTIIKTGAKIDNLVHIAHNVIVGKHTAVIANVMIGGSVVIDDYSWVAPSASLMNQVKIGKNTTIGLGAVVTKSISDNQTWAGVPARPLDEFIDIQRKLKKLL